MATGQLAFTPVTAFISTVGTNTYLIINPRIDDSTINLNSWYPFCLTNAKASMALGTPPSVHWEDAVGLCQTDLNSK